MSEAALHRAVRIGGREFKVVARGNDRSHPPVPSSKPRRNKYNAQSVVIDGIRFASKAEGERWLTLKLRVVLGEIYDLERQVAYQLAPSVRLDSEKRARPALRYVADFRYVENGQTVVEDTKGRDTPVSRMKRHLMKSVHGIDVRLS